MGFIILSIIILLLLFYCLSKLKSSFVLYPKKYFYIGFHEKKPTVGITGQRCWWILKSLATDRSGPRQLEAIGTNFRRILLGIDCSYGLWLVRSSQPWPLIGWQSPNSCLITSITYPSSNLSLRRIFKTVHVLTDFYFKSWIKKI